MDKISYALGLSMGQNLMGSGVEKLNYQDLAAGIEDVLTHQQPKISQNQLSGGTTGIEHVLPGVGAEDRRRSQRGR